MAKRVIARKQSGLLVLFLAIAAPAAAEERAYDGYQELVDYEARAAMDKGDFKRAETLFFRLVELDPDDAKALREAGRTAYALGDYSFAEKALRRVDELREGGADPEIHYIRAHALMALGGRDAEAKEELARAERELAPQPPDRLSTLWLARIYALRGDLGRAEALYRPLLGKDRKSAAYAEAYLLLVEAHVFAKKWAKAEQLLREFHYDQPDNVRAKELLAWVLESRGRVDEELEVHATLLQDWRDQPHRVVAFARALERAQDYPRALAQYRAAEGVVGEDLGPEITRLDHLLSPEVGAGFSAASDPSGSMLGIVAGVSVPLVRDWRLAIGAAQDFVDNTALGLEGRSTSFHLAGIRTHRGLDLMAGATLQVQNGDHVRPGGIAALRTRPGPAIQLAMSVAAQVPWREAAATILEGGQLDQATAQLFARPFGQRVVLVLAGEARRMGLAPMMDVETVHAKQLFGAAGLDFVLWSKPGRQARGEILDESLLWPTPFTPSLTVSYRHMEFLSDDPFGSRLVLVERSQIDEGSLVFRHVFDPSGVLGFEVRGGFGNDWQRDARLWRAGGTLLLSLASATRLTASFDTSSQTGTGIVGTRRTGWVSFHVDL
jgi:tetratricopeptide (TPR) repeat protein